MKEKVSHRLLQVGGRWECCDNPRGPARHVADGASDLIAAKKAKARQDVRETNRGVRTDVCGDTGGIADLAVQLVLVDAVGGGFLADVAGAAGEHEFVGGAVLLGVEQVRTRRRSAGERSG